MGTTGSSGSGTTEAGPSGSGTSVGAAIQTVLSSSIQSGPSSASEPADSESKAAVSPLTDNSQADSDENSEIRRRRLERFSSSASQDSADKDKKD